jgi:hypothetical protein
MSSHSISERFFSKVKQGDAHWEWAASCGSDGIGQLSVAGRPKSARRVSWELHFGEVPAGHSVFVSCPNHVCVKPEHLFTADAAKLASEKLTQDLMGQTFGLLTVESRADNNEFGALYWNCRCQCGELVTRRGNVLKAGSFFTCGKIECRFWEKVDKNGQVPAHCPELGPCWVWTGADNGGYGVLKVPGSKELVRAHSFSWELHNGPIPKGLWALHHCDNPPCVRPTHLFVGSSQDNIDDMVAKGRNRTARPHVSAETREQIRAEYRQGGATHPSLAEKYAISLNTVGRILRGE